MWKTITTSGESKYGLDYTWIDTDSSHALDKVAGVVPYIPPELAQKISEIQGNLPRGKVALYNRALPSFEYFGANRNGDAFLESPLRRFHPTFVNNANYFRHHVNKDPKLSRGRPIASAYNDKTHMVDLIIVADLDKVRDVLESLESRRPVPTSMGAHVKYDVCHICGHRAKTRAHYCEHVRRRALPPFGMNSILPDGRVCCVENPEPNFFDLSDVTIGAAPESETLMKVAALGLEEGEGEIKMADMAKRLPGQAVPFALGGNPLFRSGFRSLGRYEKEIPRRVIVDARSSSGLPGLLSTTAAMGIVLRPTEFATAMGEDDFAPPGLNEILMSEPAPEEMLTADADPTVAELLRDYYTDRSSHAPALISRVGRLQRMRDLDFGGRGRGMRHLETGGNCRRLYMGYRRLLMTAMANAGGSEGRYIGAKCAGTNTALSGDRSADYVAAVATEPNFLDDKIKMFQPFDVTGTMADEMGIESLDNLARIQRA